MDVDSLIGRKWTEIRQAARARARSPTPELYGQAIVWYLHPAWEVRMYAVQILGHCAASDPRGLSYLYERCGTDAAWQVNEGLAMAFDLYCAAIGYQAALPEIERWLRAPSPAVRRAVSEGLRPWTARSRQYFAANPQAAIAYLGILKDDESRSVQESAGNALRDIGRKHFPLVLTAVRAWVEDQPTAQPRRTIAKFALETAVKQDPTLRAIYECPR
jgi:3-methyladenine DNA glycosylase AlkC